MGMQYSRGLVAGYPFENTANDIMGVNNGTVYGAVFVDGQCGRALSFDGVDDYVNLGSNILCPPTSDWAVSFRMKPASGITNLYPTILYLKGGNYGMQIAYRPDLGGIGAGYTNGSAYFITGTMPPITKYTHICICRKSGVLEFYFDCIKQTSSAPFNNSINIISFSTIGTRFTNESTNYWKGIIDNLKIYNFPASRIITQSDIQRDYLNLPIF